MAVALGNIFEIQSKYFDIKLIIFSLVFISLRTYEKHHDVLPAFKRFKELTYLLVFSSLLRFSGLGLTAYFTKNINIVLIGGVFYQFTLSYLSYSTCKKYLKESNEKIDYIKESLQLTLTHFVTISCNSIDKAFVSFINPSLIGLYEAGTMYTFKSQEFVNTISNTITNSWADYGKNEFVVRYNRNKYLLLFSGLVFSLLLYLSADFYIPLLLGDNYIDSIPIAKTSSILIFLKISTYFYSKYILIFQNIKEYNKKIIISRTILLVTCFPFIHYFGLKGAVYSLIFSELILLLMIRKIKNLGTI
ncbi:lipopolysaccharide biosynthesis protein [Halobacteriovorax marinus]|nr:hypothetical protein [Halobacteriovorax marinus]